MHRARGVWGQGRSYDTYDCAVTMCRLLPRSPKLRGSIHISLPPDEGRRAERIVYFMGGHAACIMRRVYLSTSTYSLLA
jgi:hypothetical protein